MSDLVGLVNEDTGKGVKLTETVLPDVNQVRNNQDHTRIYDPNAHKLLAEILKELKKMNTQLSLITEEEL